MPAKEWMVTPPILQAAMPKWDWRCYPQTRWVGRTSRCGHSHGVRNGYILPAQGLDDFPKQDRLSRSSAPGVEQTLSFLSKLQDIILFLAEGERVRCLRERFQIRAARSPRY